MEKQNTNRLDQKILSDLITHSQVQQFLALAEDNGWPIQVLGQAPLPTMPLRVGNWLLVPAQQDTSLIPARTYQRIQSIYAQGLRPKGFVVVHEAPLLLKAHTAKVSPQTKTNPIPKPILKMIGAAAMGLGALTGAIAVVSVLVLGCVLLLPVVMVAGGILIDPILVAVTEDDYWIEIDRWSLPES